jgi:hypothetical protein
VWGKGRRQGVSTLFIDNGRVGSRANDSVGPSDRRLVHGAATAYRWHVARGVGMRVPF